MAIKLEKVSYQDKLKNISYEFEEGKITSIISSSGGGKTLLSYLITNLEKPTEGNIICSYRGKDLGYIFQKPEEAFIFSSVREELAFGLKKYNYKVSDLDKRIEDSLKIVSLPLSVLDKNPFKLSSGEKEKLALAIVLSLNPKVIIIDDPTVYLDNISENKLVKLLKRLKRNYNKTIIILSNDINFSLKISDNYLILKNGKIISSGKQKELLQNSDKIKSSGVELPKIIEFINTVKKEKNVSLELTSDIKELMKDIYRNVK